MAKIVVKTKRIKGLIKGPKKLLQSYLKHLAECDVDRFRVGLCFDTYSNDNPGIFFGFCPVESLRINKKLGSRNVWSLDGIVEYESGSDKLIDDIASKWKQFYGYITIELEVLTNPSENGVIGKEVPKIVDVYPSDDISIRLIRRKEGK